MAQHTALSLYVTWRLAAKNTSTWFGEVSVSGLRIGTVQPGDALPATSAGEHTLQSFLVNDASTTSTTTHLSKVQHWAGDSGGSGVDVTDGDQDGIAEAVWQFLASSQSYWPSYYQLQDIRLYAIAPGGNQPVGMSPCIYTPTSALSGTGTGMLAPENALVISTYSSVNVRKGRGRFYFGPLVQSMNDTTGLVGTGGTTVLGNAKTMLNAIRGIGSVASSRYYPAVIGHGASCGYVIQKLRLGDELDTQQRRRRQRKEQYTDLAL